MSTLRFVRELTIIVASVAGALVGYAAGQRFDSSTHVVLAFLGMAMCGAFTDFCLRGGKS